MEPSSQNIREIDTSFKNAMKLNVNSQHHDYRKLPRSSGDGMETRNSATEKVVQILDGKQVEHEVLAEPSSPPDNVSVNTPFVPTIENRNEEIAQSYYPVTELENSSSVFVPSSFGSSGICQDSHLLETEKNIIEQKSLLVEREAKCLDLNALLKDFDERNQRLTLEKEKLTNKLNGQTKVNAELKKLLVASIGEDMGLRFEEMVIEKTKFDTTLTNLETQLEEVSEDFNRMSIECDVWRTKFLASRMVTNGLTDVKTTLFMKYRSCQAALQKLLEEQSDIRQHLRATSRLLQGVYDATVDGMHGRKTNCWEKAFQKISIIELAHVNNNLAEDICHSVNPTYFYETVNNNSSPEEEIIPVTYLTPAEQMACQVLKADTEGTTNMELAMQKMGRQYIGNSYASRFLTNNFRVTFDCCDRCAGPLKVV